MVRELSKHQGAFLFDCCVFIVRFASSSYYSSAKTRIRPVKSYHLEFPSETRATCLGTTHQLLPALPSPTPPSPRDTIWHPIIESGKQLQLNTSHSIGKMAKATLLTSSANIGSLQLCGPCSSLSCSGGARLPPS